MPSFEYSLSNSALSLFMLAIFLTSVSTTQVCSSSVKNEIYTPCIIDIFTISNNSSFNLI